jgi:predicted amidophosphoribosyltransferase
LIAEIFAQQISLPILADALVRSRMTESQTSLGAFARRKNVDGAFTVRSSSVRGLSILLVDDVCTTGSTLQACADALRDGGASQVYALTVARAGWDTRSGAVGDSDR